MKRIREEISYDSVELRAILENKDFQSLWGPLKGDEVTFIGTTFLKYGDKEPYLNHIIALKDCDKMQNVENAQIECYKRERNVLFVSPKSDPDWALSLIHI